jgi:hypothetical protein
VTGDASSLHVVALQGEEVENWCQKQAKEYQTVSEIALELRLDYEDFLQALLDLWRYVHGGVWCLAHPSVAIADGPVPLSERMSEALEVVPSKGLFCNLHACLWIV